jgi:hypothetical protein
MNDTWAWTGTTWSQLTPTTSPTVRAGASFAYDPVNGGQMLLFGGYNGSAYLQDTWTWSGTTWTQLTPAASPPVREEGSFAYDTSTSQMLLFGGYSSGDLADTWSWTGTTWSALSPTTSPSARYGAPMAYSPALGELALFGGQGSAYDADTWVWTGTNWSQLSSSTYPSARVLAAMTYDPATSEMLLFGGYNGTSYLADTWQWSAVAVTAVSPAVGPVAGQGSVTITGIGFNGVTAVHFGGTNATSYTVTSSTQIVAVAPAGSVGTVHVTVTNPANTSATSSADQFTYEAAPTVTSLSPTSGALTGGTSVTVTGTNLTGATAVDFGVLAATTYTVNSSTSITATSPAVASATSVDVTVTTPVATSATSPADQFTYNPVPTVTAVSPNTGNIAGATAVTITGTGLTGATAVHFGANAATSFTINSATSISVTSPAGTAGTVDVTVTAPGGTSATSSADQFTYETVPSVTGVSPFTGLLAGGTTVTITGANFTGVSGVMFGATAATSYTYVSATSMTATAPAESVGTVNVTVTTPAGTSVTSSANQFSYYTNPSWSQASPATYPAALQGAAEAYDPATGQTILFGGNNGSADVANTWAWNGTTWSELATTGPTAAQETSMAYDPTTSQLLLFEGWASGGDIGTTWAWNSTTSAWTEVASTGPLARNGASMAYDQATSQLILSGGQNGPSTQYNDTWKWTGSAWAQVDGSGCTTACTNSPSPRYIASMAYDPATGQLVLFGGYNTTNGYLSDTWTWNGTTWAQQSPVTSPLARNGASMAYDTATSQMILFGGNNSGTYYNDTWYWTGSTWVQVSDASDPGCTTACTSSPSGRTLYPLAYDTSSAQMVLFGGQISGGVTGDTWLMGAPSVTALSPSSSLPAGGTIVVITGSSFTGAPATGAVMFGSSAAASYTVNSATQITATSPPGTLGTVDVTVTTPDGTSTTSVLDQFTYQPAPTITAVSPAAGLTAGGTAVTITGTNFTGATAIKFGTVSAPNPIVVSSSEVVVVSPAGSAGVVDVTATTSSGTSVTSPANQFTYESAPTVTGISPPTGTPSGGTSVTIAGTGFTAASGVKFGSAAATSYTVNSATQIAATSPAQAAATVNVTVTTPVGTSATSAADHFSFDVVPAVTALNPATGSKAGGTSVVITGTGFSGASAVEFGPVAATGFVVNSATQITATSPAESVGTVDVTVVTPGGTSAVSSADSFSYGATISGVVTDANNPGGISGICVYATASDGSSGRALTGSDGSYAITGLAADSYAVKFDGTCGETQTSYDVIQWYKDASSKSAATVVTVVSGQVASGIDATLVATGVVSGVPGAPTAVSAPGAPSYVSGIGGDTSVTVTWTAPADNGSPITGYAVVATDLTSAARGGQRCTVKGAGPTSCKVTGLTNGDRYTFVITATNAVGTGPASGASSPVTPVAVPGAPTDVTATRSMVRTSATVSWTAPSSSAGSPITGYIATASGPSGQACTTTGATSCIVTGLVNGAVYTFTVVATNAMGAGPASAPSNQMRTGRWSAVALSLSAKKATYGHEQAERLSVTVYLPWARGVPTPTGTVTVTEHSTQLCVITLLAGRGSCTLSARQLVAGTYSIVATYAGNALYLGSSKARKLVVVGATRTTTALELSVSTVTYGHEQVERLSVTTTTQRAGSPTGTVVIRQASTVICTIKLREDTGSCRLSARQLATGSYSLVADYGGEAPYLASVATAKLTVVA